MIEQRMANCIQEWIDHTSGKPVEILSQLDQQQPPHP